MTELDKDRKTGASHGGDADIGHLLRAAGRRIKPPEALEREVRAAVQTEWQEVVQQRRQLRRRRRTWVVRWATAAGLIAAVVGIWLARPTFMETPDATVATVRRTNGEVWVAGSGSPARVSAVGQTLKPGEELMTGPTASAAIELEGGVAVRLDADTRIAFASRRLVLGTGAVYVDAGKEPLVARRGADKDGLSIETALGIVRHLGTQYEVRLIDGGLRVSVREGRVETASRTGGRHIAAAGERLTVSAAGQVEKQAAPGYGPQWDWIGRAAPPFAIDGRPLTEFLTSVGRELGRKVVFATSADEAEARGVLLRGDPVNLPPQAALTAVLSTTRLRSIDRDGQILIELER